MDLGQILLALVFVAIAWAVFQIPTEYLLGYAEWVREKHGLGVKVSIGFLLLVIAPCMALTLEKPGKYDLLEIVASVAALLVCVAAAWDNFQFWRLKYRHQQ